MEFWGGTFLRFFFLPGLGGLRGVMPREQGSVHQRPGCALELLGFSVHQRCAIEMVGFRRQGMGQYIC